MSIVAGFISYKQDFINIYNEEKDKYSGNHKMYATSDAHEYFADAFAEYIQNGMNLNRSCPKTYQAIKESIPLVTEERVNDVARRYRSTWNTK